MIIREGADHNDTWVSVHDWRARIAFRLALVATILVVSKLRTRHDLIIGPAAFTVTIFTSPLTAPSSPSVWLLIRTVRQV